MDRQLWRLQKPEIDTWRSPARFGCLSADWINRQDVDVVNLHWVTDGFLSIEAIGRIEKPLFWTLYDMWPFSGSEHYGPDSPSARWRSGYPTAHRVRSGRGLDIDRWTYERKLRHWSRFQERLIVIPASTWMGDLVRESSLGRAWTINKIPHLIDTETFAPMEMNLARDLLGLQFLGNEPVVLFLSSAGPSDRRKGWDLLEEALLDLGSRRTDIQVLMVGPRPTEPQREQLEERVPTKLHWIGEVTGDEKLRLLYCASNTVAVPSRMDNLPLVALEAQSCGRPVVAFEVGGLRDALASPQSGHLAVPEDPLDLAQGIEKTIAMSESPSTFVNIRESALSRWSPTQVVRQYTEIYLRASQS